MRALVQRVLKAKVSVDDIVVGEIGPGLLVFLGVHREDTERQAEYLARKVLPSRIFTDAENKMNLSVQDVKGGVLVISRFTLYGDVSKGNRPSYTDAARPEAAEKLYKFFLNLCRKSGLHIEEGKFQADMKVELVNDGPVTLWYQNESDRKI